MYMHIMCIDLACRHIMCIALACMHILLLNFLVFILDNSLKFVPSYIKIQLHLAKIYWFVYCPKLHAHLHALCMHVCIYINTYTLTAIKLCAPFFKF